MCKPGFIGNGYKCKCKWSNADLFVINKTKILLIMLNNYSRLFSLSSGPTVNGFQKVMMVKEISH